MLTGCRHICTAWAAIGLLTLVTGLATGLGDLTRVGAVAVVAFGTIRLAMVTDNLPLLARRLACRAGSVSGPEPHADSPRTFWQRPASYVLLPATGFVVMVGRILLRPPLSDDGRLLTLGLVVGALVLTVVYLSLLAADGAQAGSSAASQATRSRPAAAGAAAREPASSAGAIPEPAALDTTEFTEKVLGTERRDRTTQP